MLQVTNTQNGVAYGGVPSAAATTVISANPGRLVRAIVTVAGTGSGSVLIYDNATQGAGSVVGALPATIAVGTIYQFDVPVAGGISAVNVANGPVLVIVYS